MFLCCMHWKTESGLGMRLYICTVLYMYFVFTTWSCRGKNFEDNCRKSDAVMDDVLPGVIIDGVLGVDLKDIPGFKSQLDFTINGNSQDMRQKAQVYISI